MAFNKKELHFVFVKFEKEVAKLNLFISYIYLLKTKLFVVTNK